jgi:hypothetical protein
VWQVNDEHALMRFEFLEAIIRCSAAKYGKGIATMDLAEAVEMLFMKNVLPSLTPYSSIWPNDFREARLYTEECDDLFKKHSVLLKAIYSRYAHISVVRANRHATLDISSNVADIWYPMTSGIMSSALVLQSLLLSFVVADASSAAGIGYDPAAADCGPRFSSSMGGRSSWTTPACATRNSRCRTPRSASCGRAWP